MLNVIKLGICSDIMTAIEQLQEMHKAVIANDLTTAEKLMEAVDLKFDQIDEGLDFLTEEDPREMA